MRLVQIINTEIIHSALGHLFVSRGGYTVERNTVRKVEILQRFSYYHTKFEWKKMDKSV